MLTLERCDLSYDQWVIFIKEKEHKAVVYARKKSKNAHDFPDRGNFIKCNSTHC